MSDLARKPTDRPMGSTSNPQDDDLYTGALEIDVLVGNNAGLRFRWEANRARALRFGGGARYSDTDFEALEPWIEELASTGEFGLDLPRKVSLTWNYNDMGLGMQRAYLGVQVGLPSSRQPDTPVPDPILERRAP